MMKLTSLLFGLTLVWVGCSGSGSSDGNAAVSSPTSLNSCTTSNPGGCLQIYTNASGSAASLVTAYPVKKATLKNVKTSTGGAQILKLPPSFKLVPGQISAPFTISVSSGLTQAGLCLRNCPTTGACTTDVTCYGPIAVTDKTITVYLKQSALSSTTLNSQSKQNALKSETVTGDINLVFQLLTTRQVNDLLNALLALLNTDNSLPSSVSISSPVVSQAAFNSVVSSIATSSSATPAASTQSPTSLSSSSGQNTCDATLAGSCSSGMCDLVSGATSGRCSSSCTDSDTCSTASVKSGTCSSNMCYCNFTAAVSGTCGAGYDTCDMGSCTSGTCTSSNFCSTATVKAGTCNGSNACQCDTTRTSDNTCISASVCDAGSCGAGCSGTDICSSSSIVNGACSSGSCLCQTTEINSCASPGQICLASTAITQTGTCSGTCTVDHPCSLSGTIASGHCSGGICLACTGTFGGSLNDREAGCPCAAPEDCMSNASNGGGICA